MLLRNTILRGLEVDLRATFRLAVFVSEKRQQLRALRARSCMRVSVAIFATQSRKSTPGISRRVFRRFFQTGEKAALFRCLEKRENTLKHVLLFNFLSAIRRSKSAIRRQMAISGGKQAHLCGPLKFGTK